MQVKDKVFILKTIKYGESDLIVHCLSANEGLLNLIAKGAMRSKKRFGGGVLEPTHYVHISYRKKKDSTEDTLHLLQEAQIIEDFQGLRVHYERLDMALYFLTLIHRVSHLGDPHAPQIFNLLGNALRALLKGEEFKALKTHFELKLLYHEGVLPPELTESNYLSKPISGYQEVEMGDKDRDRLNQGLRRIINNYVN